MEIARRHAGHRVVGVFAAGGDHAVDDRSGLPDQAEGLPFHVHYVHHLDRHQFVRRVMDAVNLW